VIINRMVVATNVAWVLLAVLKLTMVIVYSSFDIVSLLSIPDSAARLAQSLLACRLALTVAILFFWGLFSNSCLYCFISHSSSVVYCTLFHCMKSVSSIHCKTATVAC